MCLIFLSVNNHPVYKLIVAGNRDEFYQRKTAPAEYWPDKPEILGGRDLEAGGTWMGITKSGKISMITNYRDPANIDPKAPSRGMLVTDFLEKEIDPGQYLKEVEKIGKRYNGYNLLCGTTDQIWYQSNYREGVEKLGSGLYGLSNHLLDTPWPKVLRGKKKLQPLLSQSKVDPEALFDLLFDDNRAEDKLLPETGIGLEKERALSSMFIKTPNYGSRCSTVILIDNENKVTFLERVFDLNTFAHTTRRFEFVARQTG